MHTYFLLLPLVDLPEHMHTALYTLLTPQLHLNDILGAASAYGDWSAALLLKIHLGGGV